MAINLKIKEGFISKDECQELLAWSEKCTPLLNKNPLGLNRYSNNINNLPENALVQTIQEKVLRTYNLTDVDKTDGKIGSILSLQTEGAFVHQHNDEVDGKRHLRFNLFLSVPESGGVPVYDGKEITVMEGMLVPYEADSFLHSSTPVVGNKPRVIISFGWEFDGL